MFSCEPILIKKKTTWKPSTYEDKLQTKHFKQSRREIVWHFSKKIHLSPKLRAKIFPHSVY